MIEIDGEPGLRPAAAAAAGAAGVADG
ncbi:MAG: hypothetical protein QOJ57_2592, partial [Thermoleophilaceae bacterium]|nr:hypothetical protein [Thermoleophilaceae bacterium]